MLDAIARDLRYSLRVLRKTPAPVTYIGVSVFFLLVSAAASLAPALLARLDPATTLRSD